MIINIYNFEKKFIKLKFEFEVTFSISVNIFNDIIQDGMFCDE